MTDAVAVEKKQDNEAEKAPQKATRTVRNVLDAVALLDRAAQAKDTVYTLRAVHAVLTLRKSAESGALLKKLAEENSSRYAFLSEFVKIENDSAMTDEDSKKAAADDNNHKALSDAGAAVVGLLCAMKLLDSTPCSEQAINAAYVICKEIMSKMCPKMDPSLDLFAARVCYYFARAAELKRDVPKQDVRSSLMLAHREAGMRRMEETRATLVNALLRSFLSENLFEQADMLATKAPVRSQATSAQLARFYYYQGRICSVKLDYSHAHELLEQALRKAPQSTALGFRVAATKLCVVVQLLMGDIPERSVLVQKDMRKALAPYLRLTQAVRTGDLRAFHEEVSKDEAVFARDGLRNLVLRLRHNVIKTALRMICLTYSRITIADIAQRLQIDVEDCEFVVAKAIHDGVIDAVIDHDGGFVRSKENVDIYATTAPQAAFERRIRLCLRLHDEARDAMRYIPNSDKPSDKTHNPDSDDIDELRRALEEEEGGDDDDDNDDDEM